MELLDGAYSYYAKALVGLLAIVDPLGVVPVFLALFPGRGTVQQRQVARRTAAAVAVILLLGLWAGELILGLLGIQLPAFRVGGGLLILLMAVAMMHAHLSAGRQTREEADEAGSREDVAVVPLAMPLLAGPGALSLIIVLAHQAPGWPGRLGLSLVVLVVAAAVWLVLRLAGFLGERLGVTGLNIATRVMGLLLAAIAVQMIAQGLRELFPGLAA